MGKPQSEASKIVNRLFCMGEPGNEAKLYMTKATNFWRQQFLIGA